MRAFALVLVLAGTAEADRPSDFVDVAKLVPAAVLALRYSPAHNFTGKQLYPVAHCKLSRAVADKLVAAALSLCVLFLLVLWLFVFVVRFFL